MMFHIFLLFSHYLTSKVIQMKILQLLIAILICCSFTSSASNSTLLTRSLLISDLPEEVEARCITDINKDGYKDILFTTSFQDLVIYQGNSFEQYETKTLRLSHRSRFILTNDFNGDGYTDIVTSGSMLLGTQDGEFIPATFEYQGLTGISNDINNDDIPDLILGNINPQSISDIKILLCDGDGNFTETCNFAYDFRILYPFELTDLNYDGLKDLLFGFYYYIDEHNSIPEIVENICYLLNDGEGVFDENYKFIAYGSKYSITDVNRDGCQDILTLTNPLRCFLNDGTGNFTKTWESYQEFWGGIGPLGYTAIKYDIDRDGLSDICLLGTKHYEMDLSNNYSFFLGNGDGTFKERQDGIIEGEDIDDDSLLKEVMVKDIYNDGSEEIVMFWRGVLNNSLYVITPQISTKVYNTPLPQDVVLHQNYPNPFNSSTMITFELTQSTVIDISVFNILGQNIRSLYNDLLFSPGIYSMVWDGKNQSNQSVGGGIYIVQLTTPFFERTIKTTYQP